MSDRVDCNCHSLALCSEKVSDSIDISCMYIDVCIFIVVHVEVSSSEEEEDDVFVVEPNEERRKARRELLSSCRLIRDGHKNAAQAQMKIAEVCQHCQSC